jgi:hypothetical protein
MAKIMTDEEKSAMADRVQEARFKILEDRKELAKGAVKLTNKLLKGVGYKEEIPVRLITGEYGLLEINALAEGEIVEILDEVGLSNLQAKGEDAFSKEQYNFFWALVAASSGLDKKLIKKTFALGESAVVGNVILQISGFGEGAAEEVESFPEQ